LMRLQWERKKFTLCYSVYSEELSLEHNKKSSFPTLSFPEGEITKYQNNKEE
jgi:hypothetical protein